MATSLKIMMKKEPPELIWWLASFLLVADLWRAMYSFVYFQYVNYQITGSENPRVGSSILPLGTITHQGFALFSFLKFTILATNDSLL